MVALFPFILVKEASFQEEDQVVSCQEESHPEGVVLSLVVVHPLVFPFPFLVVEPCPLVVLQLLFLDPLNLGEPYHREVLFRLICPWVELYRALGQLLDLRLSV